MSNKTIVIHHDADFDGIFCREIARKFLPEAELIGWDYGKPVPEVPLDAKLYMLDISIEPLMGHPRLTWIDHHKSAMEKYKPAPIGGTEGLRWQGDRAAYCIDGVAACRLAWQWFTVPKQERHEVIPLPVLEEYTHRKVNEPVAVRLAGEYDIWDKRNPDAELFQHGLRSEELHSTVWDNLLDLNGGGAVVRLLNQGRAIQYAKTQENAGIIRDYGFRLDWEGLTFLACNHARFNSLLFTAGLKPEHEACFGFVWDAQKSKWKVSLYHAPGKEHHDLSLIATKYGGGGHRGACGFLLGKNQLPF